MSLELIWDDSLVLEQPHSPLLLLPDSLHERWRWVGLVTDLQMGAAWGTSITPLASYAKRHSVLLEL